MKNKLVPAQPWPEPPPSNGRSWRTEKTVQQEKTKQEIVDLIHAGDRVIVATMAAIAAFFLGVTLAWWIGVLVMMVGFLLVLAMYQVELRKRLEQLQNLP